MITLDDRNTVIAAILTLLIGRLLTRKVKFLNHFNIPDAVSGGLIVSLLFTLLYLFSNITVEFDLEFRDKLLVMFFTTIGLSSDFSSLKQGGKPLIVLLVAAVGFLFIQNIVGVSVLSLFGFDPKMGVIGGSISLSGGHGTAIAWGTNFKNLYGMEEALPIGLACATFGLTFGGIVGGPVASMLQKRHNLKSEEKGGITVGVEDEEEENITADSVFALAFIMAIAIGMGIQLNSYLSSIGVNLPLFVCSLFSGILLTNTLPFILKKYKEQIPPPRKPVLGLVSDITLGLFLSMSLMSLKLYSLVELAGPILVLMLAQVLAVFFYATLVVLRNIGQWCVCKVFGGGFVGRSHGATP
ncbi:MAG: sodium/glutamate symporter, partial [Bacteroidota bacterium]